MAQDEDIVFNVKLENSKSLTELKKLFKEQQAELQRAEKGTEAYYKALQRLGNIKDEIGDLRDTISALNPEGKVAAFSNVAGKLASGFQAATGAAALFGVESKELEETLLKVQAATAFAEGIRNLSGLGDAFAVVGTVIKTNVIPAITTLKGALLATGIGAIAAAIGVLIYKVNEYNDAIEEEYEAQKKLNEELKKTTDQYLKQADASEKLRNARKGGLNDLERELKLMEAQGASADDIAKKKQQIVDAEIHNLKVRFYTIKGNAELEADIQQKILDKEAEKQAIFLANEKRKRDEAAKTAEEQEKLFQETIREQYDLQEKGRAQALEDKKYADELYLKTIDELFAEEDKRIEEHNKQKLQDQRDFQDVWNQLTAEEDKRIEDQKKRELELERQKQQDMFAIAQASAQSQQSLSDLYFTIRLANVKKGSAEEEKVARRQFQINKTLQIQTAIISGIQGVVNALTAQWAIPEPYATVGRIVTAASVGIATAAQVAKIASVQFNSNASGSADTSAPNVNTAAPQIQTQAPTIQPTTRLDDSGRNLNNITVKAEVVETESTQTQKRVARLENQASFG